ncbi:hypothetical protein E2C01_092930 [Portunus trituberculatus]|uniref:Uncharacterized protein n=1 Tax=Portunus trituberculatus TaxID=210409 RepID=A0A5B7JX96_PORTR|nr:hypothetical protein [Portunus trituberculatus]
MGTSEEKRRSNIISEQKLSDPVLRRLRKHYDAMLEANATTRRDAKIEKRHILVESKWIIN